MKKSGTSCTHGLTSCASSVEPSRKLPRASNRLQCTYPRQAEVLPPESDAIMPAMLREQLPQILRESQAMAHPDRRGPVEIPSPARVCSISCVMLATRQHLRGRFLDALSTRPEHRLHLILRRLRRCNLSITHHLRRARLRYRNRNGSSPVTRPPPQHHLNTDHTPIKVRTVRGNTRARTTVQAGSHVEFGRLSWRRRGVGHDGTRLIQSRRSCADMHGKKDRVGGGQIL